ncbi:hypothetical protein [Paenibacillus glycinis]|uniref:GAF domain-containing protein n=1 Tax=Paenibacillus glycinis TaxID=2697035 RepID=A0ABW9XZ71_9BACL|nr:hypothetical protein [Paenibacillus glycinis]NBD28005.1 hypothetical protein [Paenibacillus glycinis]
MEDNKSDVEFGFATVTGKGLVFNNKLYSNAQMIKSQWFDLAQRTGSWTIPVLYNPEVEGHLVLLDVGGLEVASSIEEQQVIDPVILESYYSALNSLKERMEIKNRK